MKVQEFGKKLEEMERLMISSFDGYKFLSSETPNKSESFSANSSHPPYVHSFVHCSSENPAEENKDNKFDSLPKHIQILGRISTVLESLNSPKKKKKDFCFQNKGTLVEKNQKYGGLFGPSYSLSENEQIAFTLLNSTNVKNKFNFQNPRDAQISNYNEITYQNQNFIITPANFSISTVFLLF